VRREEAVGEVDAEEVAGEVAEDTADMNVGIVLKAA
jgi:hypothetical protein